MATDKQQKANKLNAQHSTGPKTQHGKIRSSRNAIRHGLNLRPDLLSPEIQCLQALFIEDGISQEQALLLAEAHSTRARVREARGQAWMEIYNSLEMDPNGRGKMHHYSEDSLRDIDLEMGGKFWRALLAHELAAPFVDDEDRQEQVTITFLTKQRRLNRYDVRAVSLLAKRFKQAYLDK